MTSVVATESPLHVALMVEILRHQYLGEQGHGYQHLSLSGLLLLGQQLVPACAGQQQVGWLLHQLW